MASFPSQKFWTQDFQTTQDLRTTPMKHWTQEKLILPLRPNQPFIDNFDRRNTRVNDRPLFCSDKVTRDFPDDGIMWSESPFNRNVYTNPNLVIPLTYDDKKYKFLYSRSLVVLRDENGKRVLPPSPADRHDDRPVYYELYCPKDNDLWEKMTSAKIGRGLLTHKFVESDDLVKIYLKGYPYGLDSPPPASLPPFPTQESMSPPKGPNGRGPIPLDSALFDKWVKEHMADPLAEMEAQEAAELAATATAKQRAMSYLEDEDNEQEDTIPGPVLFKRALFSCLLYTSPSPRDQRGSRMPSSA